jgi:RNA polymerase sigma-70 factor, ECF subfamily
MSGEQGIGKPLTEQTKTRRFEAIALPHLDAAYNLARWLTRNDRDAEDVVQEAFLRAFKFFGSFHGENGRAWLLGIVRNTCYTWLQQNRKQDLNTPFDEESHSFGLQGQSQPDNNPETILARNEDLQRLNEALEKLPLEFREVVVLRDLEDLSYKEIAEVAAIPIGTVMSRLARGRRLLLACVRPLQQESCDGL